MRDLFFIFITLILSGIALFFYSRYWILSLRDRQIYLNLRELVALASLEVLSLRIVLYLMDRFSFAYGELMAFDPDEGTFKTIFFQDEHQSQRYTQERRISDYVFIEKERLRIYIYSPLLIWIEDFNRVLDLESVQKGLYPYSNQEELSAYFQNMGIHYLIPLVLNGSLIGLIHLGAAKAKVSRWRGLVQRWDKLRFLGRWRFFAAMVVSHAILYKRMTELNIQLEERVQERTKDLEDATSQLIQSEKMASIGMLIAGVSHEINTPIGVAKGSIENIFRTNEQLLREFMELSRYPWSHKEIMCLYRVMLQIFYQEKGTKLSARERMRLESMFEGQLARSIGDGSNASMADLAQVIVEHDLSRRLKDIEHLMATIEPGVIARMIEQIANWKTNIHNINYAIGNVVRIVQALRNYSRSDYQSVVLFPIQEGIDNTLIILTNYVKKIGSLVKNYQTIPLIRCYADMLNQVWTNLLMNSIAAIQEKVEKNLITQQDTSLEVALEYKAGALPLLDDYKNYSEVMDQSYQNGWVLVRIRDNGIGMKEEIMDKIFQLFFTTKGHGQGTGLGLGIVLNILKKHNARIYAKSRFQEGSEFIVALPENWLPLS